ncbi:MAG: histidine phosphatase [Actinomycetia bacterium]|nr:histidine phosphatase [Actinomycetes bacterium]
MRHGQSEWNSQQRWQGWIDVPLTALGEAQARARGLELAGGGVDAPVVFASDLVRARRTADIIAEHLGAGVVTDERLRERHGGEWQGHTAAEIDELWPGWRERWGKREVAAPPGGESDDAVLDRFDTALVDVLAATPAEQDAIIVTHGGMLRLLAARTGITSRDVVSNLGGHWFRHDGDTLVADEPLPPLSQDGALKVE